ncbi:MAG: hypothetical protein O7G85_08000, partial [Planctomycetota bacterium]|nr:hypothetical protein [Planctomycetota bacterium]
MGDLVLVGKLVIGLVCVTTTILLLKHPKPFAIENKSFDRLALLVTLISRVGLFAGLYLVMDFKVGSDVGGYYFPEGQAVLEGQMVYRDIKTSYSPLFPYLMAGILLIWNSAKAIVLSMIPIELISIPLWLGVSRRYFSEQTTRTATILYVLSPVPLLNIAMNGQNQVWISLFLVIALWLLARKDFASGFLFGISLALIKLLGLL